VARVVARVNPAYPVNARADCAPAAAVAVGSTAEVALPGCPGSAPAVAAETVASAALVAEQGRR